MKSINTEVFSEKLRLKAIKLQSQEILISRLTGSLQEQDLSTPTNCDGYGRIRHFRYANSTKWSSNPLPIYPAARYLHIDTPDMLTAQVFQNAACNWRCWYCYVDFNRLSANMRYSKYFRPEQLIQSYLEIDVADRPLIIDLSGGQPDIVPEWVVWTIEALEKYQLSETVFLWSDDNLSNDYFWRYLSPRQRLKIARYPGYGRVGCFKGYDPKSFAFNTTAAMNLYDQQFDLFARLLTLQFDLYAYVTFTSLPTDDAETLMRQFVDRLQEIHENLPLRTIPLEIFAFGPTEPRVTPAYETALSYQYEIHQLWLEELSKRFSDEQRTKAIFDVKLTTQ